MKKSQILATLALAFALGLSIAPAVHAEEEPAPVVETEATPEETPAEDAPVVDSVDEAPVEQADGASASETTVSNEADLKAALENPAITKITVDSDITVTAPITVNRVADDGSYITPNVEVDLGAHTISGDPSVNTIFTINNAAASFNNGTIDASNNANGIAIRMYGHATADSGETYVVVGPDTTLKAGNTDYGYGVAIFAATGTNSAFGTALTMQGTIDAPNGNGITIHGNIQNKTTGQSSNSTGYPFVDVSGKISAPSDTGIYAPGYSNLYIAPGATVTGATGITLKAGKLFVDKGATVEGTGTPAAGVPNNSGAAATGAGIQVEANNVYAGEVEITIYDGATVKSTNNSAIYQYSTADATDDKGVKEILVSEGATLESATGKENIEGVAENKVSSITTTPEEQPKEDEKKDDEAAAKKPGNLGVVSESTGNARATASTLAAISTALTVAGAGVVAYRADRRKANKEA